jgi:hypothetical protein
VVNVATLLGLGSNATPQTIANPGQMQEQSQLNRQVVGL